jgi:C4-dicarboxylate-specific signal transduction histidine kinase
MAVAQGYFQQVKEGLGHNIESLALSERLAQTLSARPSEVQNLLREVALRQKIDYLILLDSKGHTLASSAARGSLSSIADNETIRRARRGQASSEIDVLNANVLAAIDPELANKARTALIPTRNAQPTRQSEESRGMVVHAAASVGVDGAVLVGGMLLNGNLAVVDRINEVVYPQDALPLGSVGTVTLFLDDVRIATNVRLFEGKRAIGTRVSAAVRTAVLSNGQSWRDRAFVVDDWYVSAYEPLLNHHGERIGMLYVGFLEQPFAHARLLALAAFILIFLLVALAAATLSLRLARHVSMPVKKMRAVMHDIEQGVSTARVGALQGTDELTDLGLHFDQLLDKLADQTNVLHRWGVELDHKVAERTAELEAANASLRSAQQRLRISEKLAAIGQLAAGVAHEVNNPVAVIQGNLDVLRDTLGSSADPVLHEIRLIQDQVYRIRLIITKLLQFARPTEYAGYLEAVQLDVVVQDSLVLIAHQFKKSHVSVFQNLQPCQPIMRNRNELQQVLINLMVNAMQAMQGLDQAIMTLTTGALARDGMPGVFVSVADNGPGIPVAHRERLFDPFFTTKSVDGTGLGLWVSDGLVQRYGGRIEIDCPSTGGTVFTVWLPLDQTIFVVDRRISQ